MRRNAVLTLLVLMLGLVAFAAAGCGGGEEVAPTAGDFEGQTQTDDAAGTETDEQEEEPAAEGDAEAGEAIFSAQGCGGCHALDAAGSSGTVGPDLDEAQPSFEEAVETITNGSGAMPAFEDRLSEEEIRNVAAYVVESSGGS